MLEEVRVPIISTVPGNVNPGKLGIITLPLEFAASDRCAFKLPVDIVSSSNRAAKNTIVGDGFILDRRFILFDKYGSTPHFNAHWSLLLCSGRLFLIRWYSISMMSIVLIEHLLVDLHLVDYFGYVLCLTGCNLPDIEVERFLVE
jgi:hypothetical protein